MRPLTTRQRAVLETPGHLLVDAGAGSGKTTTVVQALCHQLGVPVQAAGGPLAPMAQPLTFEEVAAITFTNQAAADLKRKLRAALRAAGRADLATEVDAARIGTIHSFCIDLLRDFALRAGVRPGRTVLTDAEAAAALEDRVREVLHAALEQGDVEGLGDLLAGRRLAQVAEWLVRAAADADRLQRWARHAEALRPHERAFLTLARRAGTAHTQHLDARGELDFDRMIVATRDLLADEAVRRAVQRRVRLLVVDEYQDVDPVQRDIAERLGGLAFDDPAPTRLILVGDPKQSIYRFRRADVTVWNATAARFSGGAGRVVELRENFRSKAAILGFVDTFVGAQLDAPVDAGAGRQPFEVDYVPLEPCAPDHEGDEAVEFLVAPARPDGKAMKADDVRDLEAAGIAARVRALRADGFAWRDIAIVLAGWGAVDRYADALRRAGVPAYVRRGEGFWEAREVLDAVLLLRVLRDPGDDVAMVGLLKGPLVGVRDDTLLALARARGDRPFAAALTEVPQERERLAAAAAVLERHVPLRDRLPAHELLQRVLEETGLLAVAALLDEGAQRVANLRKLVRLAAAAPERSLGEFLREVDLARARGEAEPPERLHAEGGDVVTLTTIHGAKGLEWPVVIWADLVRAARAEHEALIVGRDRFAIRETVPGDEEGDGDQAHAEARTREAREEEAERRRLWYVAATRAKSRLILSGIPLGDSSAVTPARRLRDAFPALGAADAVEYANHAGHRFRARVQALAPTAEASPIVETPPVLPLPPAPVVVPRGAVRLSATQLMAFAADPAQWRRTYVTRFDPALVGADGRATGRAIVEGQVVHDVLERVGDGDADLELLLEQAIARWDEEAPEAESDLGRRYRARLRERIEAARAAPAWRALAEHPSARRELAFLHVLPDGTALTGAFDLVARDGDAVRLLDVKNSAAPPDALAARYGVQAAVYATAARAITGVATCDFTLLALPSAAAVAVAPAEGLASLIARLRDPAVTSGRAPRRPAS